MTPVIVRRGTDDDRAAALEVWRAALGGTGRRPSTTRVQEVREQLERDLLVVCDDGVQVGLVGIATGRAAGGDDPALLDVTGVHVLPARWRTGVGAAMLEGLADEAWDLGYRRIACQTIDPPLVGLLKAVGLQPGEHAWTGELEAPVRDVAVFSDGIRLGQFLKLAGLVDTGAEAKALLADGGVQVNGEPDQRRGRQLIEGDVVTARDCAVRVHLPR